MMHLTTHEHDLAITTLKARGIEGSDAEASLEVLCRLAPATSLYAWRRQHYGSGSADLMALYGSDASRAALVLLKHSPSPFPTPS